MAAAGLALSIAGTMDRVATALRPAADIIEQAAITGMTLRTADREALGEAIASVEILAMWLEHEFLPACARELKRWLNNAAPSAEPRSEKDEIELVEGATMHLRGTLEWRPWPNDDRVRPTPHRYIVAELAPSFGRGLYEMPMPTLEAATECFDERVRTTTIVLGSPGALILADRRSQQILRSTVEVDAAHHRELAERFAWSKTEKLGYRHNSWSDAALDEQEPYVEAVGADDVPRSLQQDVDELVAAAHRRVDPPPAGPFERVTAWYKSQDDESSFLLTNGEGFIVLWRGSTLSTCSDWESEWEDDVDPADITDEDRALYIMYRLRLLFEYEPEMFESGTMAASIPIRSTSGKEARLGFFAVGGGCMDAPRITWHGVYRSERSFRAALRREGALTSLRDASRLSRAELLEFWER